MLYIVKQIKNNFSRLIMSYATENSSFITPENKNDVVPVSISETTLESKE